MTASPQGEALIAVNYNLPQIIGAYDLVVFMHKIGRLGVLVDASGKTGYNQDI